MMPTGMTSVSATAARLIGESSTGLEKLVRHLESVGCTAIYVDGSFITTKERPNDYDACWNIDGVKIEKVDKILLNFSDEGKVEMQKEYGGDIRPGACSPVESKATYLEFFQTDRNGNRKGIVKLTLRSIGNDQEQ